MNLFLTFELILVLIRFFYTDTLVKCVASATNSELSTSFDLDAARQLCYLLGFYPNYNFLNSFIRHDLSFEFSRLRPTTTNEVARIQDERSVVIQIQRWILFVWIIKVSYQNEHTRRLRCSSFRFASN